MRVQNARPARRRRSSRPAATVERFDLLAELSALVRRYALEPDRLLQRTDLSFYIDRAKQDLAASVANAPQDARDGLRAAALLGHLEATFETVASVAQMLERWRSAQLQAASRENEIGALDMHAFHFVQSILTDPEACLAVPRVHVH